MGIRGDNRSRADGNGRGLSCVSRFIPVSGSELPDSAKVLLTDLSNVFNLTWVAIIPLLMVLWGIMRKYPPALAIVLSAVVALVIAIAVQGISPINALTAAVSGVKVRAIARGCDVGVSSYRVYDGCGRLEFDTFHFRVGEISPAIALGNRLLFAGECGALVRHLEKEQEGELFEVVVVAEAVVAEDLAITPKQRLRVLGLRFHS